MKLANAYLETLANVTWAVLLCKCLTLRMLASHSEMSVRRRRVWPGSLLALRVRGEKNQLLKSYCRSSRLWLWRIIGVQRSAVINVPNGRPSVCKYTFITPLPAVIAVFLLLLFYPLHPTPRPQLHSAVHVRSHTIYSITFQTIHIH